MRHTRQLAQALGSPVSRPVLLALAMLSSGCAVNDHGLVRVSRYENETAYVVRLESWGGHLLTTAGDSGFTLGYMNRTYVFRKGDGEARVPLAVLVGSSGDVQPSTCDACPSLSELGSPIFRAGQGVGLILDANSDRVGIAFGMRLRAALVLPTDGSAVVLLKYNAGDSMPPQVIIGKEIER